MPFESSFRHSDYIVAATAVISLKSGSRDWTPSSRGSCLVLHRHNREGALTEVSQNSFVLCSSFRPLSIHLLLTALPAYPHPIRCFHIYNVSLKQWQRPQWQLQARHHLQSQLCSMQHRQHCITSSHRSHSRTTSKIRMGPTL